MEINATASINRIKKLVSEERGHWEYVGQNNDNDLYNRCFHIRDKRTGAKYGYDTKENALHTLEIEIVIGVLVNGLDMPWSTPIF